MAAQQQKKNTVGRPVGADSEKVRFDLLAAARQHFLVSEFKAVSVRQIAETAGVNGAMVNYYFGSKQGLYLAMVDQLLGSLEEDLAQIGKQHQLTAADFSRSYARVLQANPWWPNFMVREVLFGESETRDAMVQRFASSFAPQLIASISGEIEAGRYRENLNPAMVMISLMGMTVFPFLAKPMIESVLQMQLSDGFVETLADHNVALFHYGVLSESSSAASAKMQTQQDSGAAGE